MSLINHIFSHFLIVFLLDVGDLAFCAGACDGKLEARRGFLLLLHLMSLLLQLIHRHLIHLPLTPRLPHRLTSDDLLTNFRHKLCAEMGRLVACHACLALMAPMTYRPIIYPSRTASCKSCASGSSQPCYRLWRSYIYATASRSRRRTAFRT